MTQTPKGFPYVLPGDAVADYPDVSQALATRLEAAVPHAQAAGTVNVTLTNAQSGSTVVTLPAGRFTTTPILSATKRSALGPAGALVPMVTAASSTSFTVGLFASPTAQTITVAVMWTAVQMTPTTSEG